MQAAIDGKQDDGPRLGHALRFLFICTAAEGDCQPKHTPKDTVLTTHTMMVMTQEGGTISRASQTCRLDRRKLKWNSTRLGPSG